MQLTFTRALKLKFTLVRTFIGALKLKFTLDKMFPSLVGLHKTPMVRKVMFLSKTCFFQKQIFEVKPTLFILQ